jgi:hypothetical protein
VSGAVLSARERAGTAEDAPEVLVVEERLPRDHALRGEKEAVRRILVCAQRRPQPELLVGRRLEPGAREVLVIVGQRGRVAPPLVVAGDPLRA